MESVLVLHFFTLARNTSPVFTEMEKSDFSQSSLYRVIQ